MDPPPVRPSWLKTYQIALLVFLLFYDSIIAVLDYMGANYVPAHAISVAHYSDIMTMEVLRALRRNIYVLAVPAVCWLFASYVYYAPPGGAWHSLGATITKEGSHFVSGWAFMALLSSFYVLKCHLDFDLGSSVSEWIMMTIETGSAHIVLVYFSVLIMAHTPLLYALRAVSPDDKTGESETKDEGGVAPSLWLQIAPYVGVVLAISLVNPVAGLISAVAVFIWNEWGYGGSRLRGWGKGQPLCTASRKWTHLMVYSVRAHMLSYHRALVHHKVIPWGAMLICFSLLPSALLMAVRQLFPGPTAAAGVLFTYLGMPLVVISFPSQSAVLPRVRWPTFLCGTASVDRSVHLNTGLVALAMVVCGHLLLAVNADEIVQADVYMSHFSHFFQLERMLRPCAWMALNHSMYIIAGFLYFSYHARFPEVPRSGLPGILFCVAMVFGFKLFHPTAEEDFVQVVSRFTLATYRWRWERVWVVAGSYFELLFFFFAIRHTLTAQQPGAAARFVRRCSFGVLVVYKIVLVGLACALHELDYPLRLKALVLCVGVFCLSYGMVGGVLRLLPRGGGLAGSLPASPHSRRPRSLSARRAGGELRADLKGPAV